MKRMIKVMLLLLALTYATKSISCDYPTEVSANDTVVCSGTILTNKQFIDASNDKKNLRLKDFKIAMLEGTVELMDMRHNSYKKELNESRDKLSDLQFKSNIGYAISFSLGAVITGLLAKELVR